MSESVCIAVCNCVCVLRMAVAMHQVILHSSTNSLSQPPASLSHHRGAKVIVANRNRQRAEQLVGAMQSSEASVVDWADLQAGQVKADVLANSTSIGMAPKVWVCVLCAYCVCAYCVCVCVVCVLCVCVRLCVCV